jgi:hypothetical protein
MKRPLQRKKLLETLGNTFLRWSANCGSDPAQDDVSHPDSERELVLRVGFGVET